MFCAANFTKSIANTCAAGAIVLIGLTLSCSKKSTDPDTNKPPDNGPVGVLLSGNSSDPALSGTSDHGPFAVPESEWDGDFVTTRLEAVINPGATVGEVNTALNGLGDKISCMRAGLMFTELVVPAMSSVDQANMICSTLVTSNAFLTAYPCFDPTTGNDGAVAPGFPANIRITPLEEAKFPAAWNARGLVARRSSPVTIVVADDFGRLVAHPEIPAQTFVAGSATADTIFDSLGNVEGNHGFAVAGTIGARYDDIGSTGAFADTANILRLPCYGMGGLGSWMAILTDLASRLPYSGKFILNTSWGYGGDFTRFPKRQRIEHAFYWRALVAHRQSDFLHTQSSGNSGLFSPAQPNADYNSPFTLATRFDNPFQMLQGTEVTPADSTALTTLFAQAIVNGGIYATKLHNVITVGSSDWSGNLSSFSSGPADVRMIGENVTLPCLMGDGVCGPGTDVAWQGSYEGTSFAAPQVAALAGWLWALSPSLTVDETIGIIQNCYNSKWVDAYKAVLSVDHSIASADVRLTLLDIADGSGNMGGNMAFDEKDLQMILDSIMYYEADRGSRMPPWSRDHSRFDLNGDGYTGDTSGIPSKAPFDLDINTPPGYSTVDVIPCDQPSAGDTTLDESALTDRAIMLYYAYSPLYSGSERVRDSLFNKGCSPFILYNPSYQLKYDLRTSIELGPWDIDSSAGSFLEKTLNVRKIACNGLATFVYSVSSTCDVTLSGVVGTTSLDISGSSKSYVSGTASLENDLGATCDYNASAKSLCISVIQFSLSEELGFVPFRFVVDGTIDIGDGNTAKTNAWIFLQSVDVNGNPDGGAYAGFEGQQQSLPYVYDGLLNPLPPGHRYELLVGSSAMDGVAALTDPGPDEAVANVNVSLHVGL